MEEGPQNIGRNEGKFAPACSSKLQSSNLLKNYAGTWLCNNGSHVTMAVHVHVYDNNV